MSYKLTEDQKEEIRRLTQLANRRIINAHKEYNKAGGVIVPKEIVGEHQVKEKWVTDKVPISRSVKFDTKEAYEKQRRYLKSFELDKMGIKEYSNVQRTKIEFAVSTALNSELNEQTRKKLSKMNAVQLSNFWNNFSDKAQKMGAKYSSSATMASALEDLFEEDIDNLLDEE